MTHAAPAPDAPAPQPPRFLPARTRAERYLGNPQAALRLADAASSKFGRAPGVDLGEYVAAFIRLLRAYATGRYRSVPWESMLLVVAAILYFVSPLDLLADILPIGFLDDAAVLVFVAGMIKEELDEFLAWEQVTRAAAGSDASDSGTDATGSGKDAAGPGNERSRAP